MDLLQLERARLGFESDLPEVEGGLQFRRQLTELGFDYLKLRIDWASSAPANRQEIDAARTRAHDAFIAALDMFTRRASAQGATLARRKSFGTGGVAEERKRIGDFACYLAFDLAIQAR